MNIHELISDYRVLSDRSVVREGYVFTNITHPANIYDAIVIRAPSGSFCSSPRLKVSKRSLHEHIRFINMHAIEKAVVIAKDITFIQECPSLKYLYIIPSDDAPNNFDYSALYDLENLKYLHCATTYGLYGGKSSTVDLSKIYGLEEVNVDPKFNLNFQKLPDLRSLGISSYTHSDLSCMFCSKELDTLSMVQCRNESLNGLDCAPKIQCIYISYNRSLRDISALGKCKHTIKALRIINCPNIEDFSVLGTLENLELLELSGSNSIPSLSFIRKLKKLKTFVFNINIEDGDLSPCLDLTYVYSARNRRHYNLKDSDLPKGDYVRGNENIPLWRRYE